MFVFVRNSFDNIEFYVFPAFAVDEFDSDFERI